MEHNLDYRVDICEFDRFHGTAMKQDGKGFVIDLNLEAHFTKISVTILENSAVIMC